jgi:hypothetical protein
MGCATFCHTTNAGFVIGWSIDISHARSKSAGVRGTHALFSKRPQGGSSRQRPQSENNPELTNRPTTVAAGFLARNLAVLTRINTMVFSIIRWRFVASAAYCLSPLAGLLFLVGHPAGTAVADSLPRVCDGPRCYASTQLDSIVVKLVTELSDPQFSRLEIPRAYITAAVGYNQRVNPTLPAEVKTQHLELNVVWPDARPYTIERREISKARITSETDLSLWRRNNFLVVKRISSPEFYTNYVDQKKAQADRGEAVQSTDDGLTRRALNAAEFAYGDRGSNEFTFIDCLRRSNPWHFCQYHILIPPDVLVVASFADYRISGGRQFANERSSFVKRFVCGLLPSCRKTEQVEPVK